jgi:rare lipoprotein A (peptidoglycan hydrolase)
MRIAFPRHILLADLRSALLPAALLGCLVALALPVPGALADTGGATSTTTTTITVPAASGTSAGGTASGTTQTSKPTLATWFGPGFYGNQTACGQTMSPALVGIASRTLPCGTLVQIGYRGRTLTVPVVDRGPYGHIGASWDLTAGAAHALKIKETVRITTTIVGSLPNTPSLGEPLESSTAPSSTPSSAPPAVAASTTGGASAG